MLIDTHTHVNSKEFEEDKIEVIKKCLDQEIWMVNIGFDVASSKQAIHLSDHFDDGVFCSVGMHPDELIKEPFVKNVLKDLAKRSSKVVAIGETGLDYNRLVAGQEDMMKARQFDAFRKSIALAKELDLALVVHLRDSKENLGQAYDDAIKILTEEKAGRGVIHCFGGSPEQAKRFIELGFNIGITGIITFKNSKQLQDVVRQTPIENLVIETDAPYLTPEPHRGKRNEPSYVRLVAEKIADLKGLTFEQVAEETTVNARRMYVI